MATKTISAYRGYTAAAIKARATVPDQADMTVSGTDVLCAKINTAKIRAALVAAINKVGALNTHANVNHWSWFGPTVRSIVSQELVNSDPTTGKNLGNFAGYNHAAPTPAIVEGGGAGGSKSYDYEGTDLLVRVRVDLGEIDWPSLSADITHAYVILSHGGTEYFTLEYEITTLSEQYIGAIIDFGITADRDYSCAFWFGKPADKKILKFPGFPAFTIEAVYAVPADVEVTSVNTIPDGLEYDRMNITFNFTNSGGPGVATIYWEMYNSSNVKIDEGNAPVTFAAGSGNRALTTISYPAAGTDYTLRVKETDDASWEVSNQFDATT